jgi:hypothetical protein
MEAPPFPEIADLQRLTILKDSGYIGDEEISVREITLEGQ